MAKKQIKDLHEIVKDLLLQDIRYRNNDSLLVNRIQKTELESLGYSIDRLSVLSFFKMKAEGIITSESSITRARRKVNEHYPETRGASYKRRQQQQVEVIEEIRSIHNDKFKNQNLIKEPSALAFESEKKLSQMNDEDMFKTAHCPFCQENFDYRLAACPNC